MGAWGAGTFEDDTALDLVQEWQDSADPIPMMRSAIELALDSDYMDYTHGHTVSVASAIVDVAFAGKSALPDDHDELGSWIGLLDIDQLRPLARPLVGGIDRLLGDESELAELWAENEELYPAWQQALRDRQERLRALG